MKERLLREFAERFGNAEGAQVYFAPGRVNLIGEHTDYNKYPDFGLDNGGDRRLALDAEERQQGKNRLGRWKGTGRDR